MDEIKVVKWINDDDIDANANCIGGLGGFFKEGMRWKDYIAVWKKGAKPYIEALRKEIVSKNIRITGEEHQYGEEGVPVFSDGSIASFSYRGWGDLMAAIWAEEENKDYHYMQFYM